MNRNKAMWLFYRQNFIKELDVYAIHKLFCSEFKKYVSVSAIYNYLSRYKIAYKPLVPGRKKQSGGHWRISSKNNDKLSPAEIEILPYLKFKNSEIAKILKKGESTINTQLKNIFDKLGANSKIGALIIALKKGLINIEEIKVNARTNNH